MPSFFYRGFRYVIRRTWNLLNPRAIAWRYIKKRHPKKAIITKLGRHLKIRIYPYDVIGKDIYINGVFEKSESNFVTRFLKPGMTFLDVGANLGQYTLLSAHCVGTNGRVHSFEPSSRMFSELKFNIELNNLSNICILNNVAVSDKEGTAKLSKYEAGGEVYGSLGNQNWAESGKSIIGHEEVKTITLNGYIKKYNISHVDLIKIDIEGAELLALRGANQLLNRSDAPTIVLEMADITTDGFGYKAMEMWDYLKSLDFSLHSFDKHGNLAGPAKRPLNFACAQNLVAIKHH